MVGLLLDLMELELPHLITAITSSRSLRCCRLQQPLLTLIVMYGQILVCKDPEGGSLPPKQSLWVSLRISSSSKLNGLLTGLMEIDQCNVP